MFKALHTTTRHGSGRDNSRPREQGWALLGLLLALTVMAMVMASAVVPNVQVAVQREKENDMIYKGEQMARGIARYYSQIVPGRGGPALPGEIILQRPPQYGYLLDLKKLRDGVTVLNTEVKFVRPSAFIDPTTNEEWEPVRARDPRIRKFLDSYVSATGVVISQNMWLLAGPPGRLILANPTQPGQGTQPPGVAPRPPSREEEDDDDDDDDDGEAPPDPLAHIFGSDAISNNIPIVGVAPKRKGLAIRSYYGLDNYEDWVFIYVPPLGQVPGVNQPPGNAIPRPNIQQ
jgi:hypothetical protein